ncbi:MAG TPA: FtsX-like permease family protein [Rhodanobacteraceae bacterium]|nr:FtsX-like permease family protein [Rhodanobacteraceae bacterium]
MPIRPILSTLRHHKLTAALLAMQVALTCAIVCNAAFMVADRASRMRLPSGMAEAELSMVRSSSIDPAANLQARHAADLAALRAIPGVKAAVAVDSLPLSGSVDGYGACADKATMERAMAARAMVSGCLTFTEYSGTPGTREALGLRLVAGRDFRPGEFGTADHPPVGIVSRSLADALYPDGRAVGRTLYFPGGTLRIVGVVDTLLAPVLRKPAGYQHTMLWPKLPNRSHVTYVLRSAPADRARVLKAAVGALTRLDPQRLIPAKSVRTYADLRHDYFRRDATMIGLLLATALGLLFVTALGIAGLAGFWVQQRTRSIGIRRAIGATRGDILRYFQAENALIVGFGALLGMLLAVLLNLLLMRHYELQRLPLYYLPVGAVALWLLGQLAVLTPALRAAAVPPVVATRSV